MARDRWEVVVRIYVSKRSPCVIVKMLISRYVVRDFSELVDVGYRAD
jgi:hypothetical protein